jgi:hypothetical protein
MNDLIKTIQKGLEKINKVRSRHEGNPIIKGVFAKEFDSYVIELAEIIKPFDEPNYKNLMTIHDKMYVKYVFNGVFNGDYVVLNFYLGGLYAIVDFIQSDNYQNYFKAKESKIFISHSTKDINYVKPLVELLECMGIGEEQLFCSSIDGYRIPIDEIIPDYLQQQFEEYNLYVILMLSDNYYESPVCLNEMGAAWVLKAKYQAILLPRFNFKDVEGAIDPRKISFKLDDEKERQSRMTELKNTIVGLLGLQPPTDIKWERQRNDFLDKIDKHTALLNKLEQDLIEAMNKIEKSLDDKVIRDGYQAELETFENKRDSLLAIDTKEMTTEEFEKYLEDLNKLEVELCELSDKVTVLNSK